MGLFFFFESTFAQRGIFLQWEPEFSYTKDISDRWSSNLKLALRQNFAEPGKEGMVKDYQIDYAQLQGFVTYSLWTRTKLSMGYGFRLEDLLEASIGNEHRIMEQVGLVTHVDGKRLAHRIRAEQRFRENGLINRWRYRISYDAPLNGLRLDPGEKYLIFSNELLFSFNAAEQEGEDRLYVGLGWYFNDMRKLETGIQYRLGAIGSDNLENVIWLTSVYYLNH